MDQTEITVFRNGASLRRYEHWFYRGTQINITSEYKYLGILLTSCLSWSSAHSKLVSQAQRALFAIKAYQKYFGYFSSLIHLRFLIQWSNLYFVTLLRFVAMNM